MQNYSLAEKLHISPPLSRLLSFKKLAWFQAKFLQLLLLQSSSSPPYQPALFKLATPCLSKERNSKDAACLRQLSGLLENRIWSPPYNYEFSSQEFQAPLWLT